MIGDRIDPLPDDAWDAWTPDEMFGRLKDAGFHWYVVGGWALDLWHGRRTRRHDDLEFAVLPDAASECRVLLDDLEFFVARSGALACLDAGSALPADLWQPWGADPVARRWRVDMMIERGPWETWCYKRDASVELPRSVAIMRSAGGTPFLAPALVLLFKAKYTRSKDECDFQLALPHLSPTEKCYLRNCLANMHPGHHWIEQR